MKLINSNIEGDKHFDMVIPFLEAELPDVLCLQEVFQKDLNQFESLGYVLTFLPMTRRLINDRDEALGVALAVRHATASLEHVETYYYHHTTREVPLFDTNDKDRTVNNGVIVGKIQIAGESYTIGTTHFTWIPDGNTPTRHQRDDMSRFLTYMAKQSQHCLVGDLNIPRHHNALYGEFLKHYTDAVPASYASSLDASLHRLGNDPERAHLFTDYMVDHLLLQSPYVASDVRLKFGISDHAAVVATLKKAH